MKYVSLSASRLAAVVASFTIAASLPAANQTVAVNGNIQAAIDNCASSGGGTVSVGSGTGTISTSLRMKSKVQLSGAGNPTTTLNAGADTRVITKNGEGQTSFGVRNMKVYGRGTSGSTNCLGVIFDALSTAHSGVTLSDVQITNFAGIGCHLKRANSSSVSSVNFHNNGKDLFMHNLYVHTCGSLNVSGSQLNNSPIGTGYRHTAGSGSIKTTTSNNNGQNGHNIMESPTNFTIDGCTSNSNRNATAGRNDGIGINCQTGSGTISNNRASGNRVNYQLGSGYTKFNNL